MVAAHVTGILAGSEFLGAGRRLGAVVPNVVMGVLALVSLLSWTIIFSKWFAFAARAKCEPAVPARVSQSHAPGRSGRGQRAVPRRAAGGRFRFRLQRSGRQMAARSKITNQVALERTLQLGMSEEITRLERNMNWLATTATVIAVHRIVRHGVGHHRRVFRTGPDAAPPACGRWDRASRRRWWRRRWACSPPSRPAIFYNFFGQPDQGDRRAHGRFFARIPQLDGTEFRRVGIYR